MRIPSQFNEDSLYRRGRRRDETAQNYRRLIRMVIGLALVIVIMRQSSRPEIYQTFFGPQVAAPGDAGASAAAWDDRPRVEAVEVAPKDREIANQLVEPLLPSDQRQWTVALSRWQSGESVNEIPSTVEMALNELGRMRSIGSEDRLGWELMLRSFLDSASVESDSAAPTAIDHPRVAALLAALDDASAARVVDGSVWRSGDFDLFYRYLDQADTLSAEGVAATGVLPLLQQPDVFRNQAVRTLGSVARSERIEARENPYGIEGYWQLWLRPADGADRPIVAIVPRVPPVVAAVGREAIAEEGPTVIVVGHFLKRLAYESSIGADLAPVVIGRLVSAPVAADPSAELAEPETTASGTTWLIIAAACLAGITLAAVTMWRTSVMARRSRELRNAHRKEPDDFLNELGRGDVAAPVDDSGAAG